MDTTAAHDEVRQRLEARRHRLMDSRGLGVVAAVLKRFKDIDGGTQGVLVSVQLFTVVIPLMILGFSYFSGFAENASPGTVWPAASNCTSPWLVTSRAFCRISVSARPPSPTLSTRSVAPPSSPAGLQAASPAANATTRAERSA